MKVKFKLDPDNTITILQEDQNTTISIENNGDNKIITVDIEELEQLINITLPPSGGDE
jgi:hypothetical protein